MGWQSINVTYVNPAKKLINQGKLKEAEELLLWGFKETNDGWVAYHLGEVYLKMDETNKALEYFEIAEEKMPKPSYKKRAREGKKRALQTLKGEKAPPSWITINQVYIYPSQRMSDPHEALKLLEKGYQETQDGWVAFHMAERYREIGETKQAEKFYGIALERLPLPQYKALAQKQLRLLQIPMMKKEDLTPSIFIKEVIGPTELSPDVTSFNVEVKIQNNNPKSTILKIWFNALWANGKMGETPLFRAKGGEQSKMLLLPTPSEEGDYNLELHLLDQEGILIEDQFVQVPIEVKLSGVKKLIKWGKMLGLLFLPKI